VKTENIYWLEEGWFDMIRVIDDPSSWIVDPWNSLARLATLAFGKSTAVVVAELNAAFDISTRAGFRRVADRKGPSVIHFPYSVQLPVFAEGTSVLAQLSIGSGLLGLGQLEPTLAVTYSFCNYAAKGIRSVFDYWNYIMYGTNTTGVSIILQPVSYSGILGYPHYYAAHANTIAAYLDRNPGHEYAGRMIMSFTGHATEIASASYFWCAKPKWVLGLKDGIKTIFRDGEVIPDDVEIYLPLNLVWYITQEDGPCRPLCTGDSLEY